MTEKVNAPRLADLLPRRFILIRTKDHSGVSGTGIVAAGVRFADGKVVSRWDATRIAGQTTLWDSLEDLVKVHGHGGDTKVHWIDLDEDEA
jgi:hypothetical protein